MSKKDYQVIARAIHAAYERSGDKTVALDCLVDDLADVLKADNPRFNRALFIEECETGRCRGMSAHGRI